ncbi:hypothetical protein M0804_012120 [Polistes exclamans]|nr:hypothetical protein M0804_012120 [Polistes exclamans]
MVRRGNARAHGCIIAIPRWVRPRRARRRGQPGNAGGGGGGGGGGGKTRKGAKRRRRRSSKRVRGQQGDGEGEEEEEEESMLASPGMPADHERCRKDPLECVLLTSNLPMQRECTFDARSCIKVQRYCSAIRFPIVTLPYGLNEVLTVEWTTLRNDT